MTALATVADVGDQIGRAIPVADAARVDRLLDKASGVVRDVTSQTITVVTGDTIVLSGTCERDLWLPQRPVTAVTSVAVDGVTADPSSYRWTRQGRLFRPYGYPIDGWTWGGAWGSRDAAVTVVYSHGYTVVPEAIAAVVAEMVANRYSNPEQLRSETVEDYSVSYTQPAGGQPLSFGLTDAHRDVLERFFPPATSVAILAAGE